MDIIQYNIRGLANNRNDIDILHHLYKPTLFCLQETHIKENNSPKFNNYNIIHNYNQLATQGVAFLIKKETKYTQINLTTNIQAIAITINIPHTVHICNIYIHPTQNINEIDLQNLIDQLPQPRLILGDFNAHNPLWGSTTKNPKGTTIENFINNNALICINKNEFTYFHPSSGTATKIDLTLSNPSIATVLTWRTLEQLQSDHVPILISTFKHNNNTTYPPSNSIRYNKIDWTKFKESLKNTPINSHSTVHSRINHLTNTIRTALKNSQTESNYKTHKKSVPWWSKELSILKRDKNKALKKFTREPTTTNRLIFNEIKLKYRNEIIKQKESTWNLFINNINNSTSPKDFWKQINRVNGKKSHHEITTLNLNGNIVHDPTIIANTLACNFTIQTTDNTNRRKNILKATKKLNIVQTETVHQINKNISKIEFDTALHTTKNTSSPGHDEINYHAIKNLPDHLTYELINIYNKVLKEGKYPNDWKTAKVTPILKKNADPFNPNSYRPISLLSCFSKLLEKILTKRLQYWISVEKLMTPNQLGYQLGLSTTDALIKVSTYTINNINKKSHIDALALDMTKAFDKCWPEVIIAQLKKWGLSGPILDLIFSFLTNRKLQICHMSLKSDIHPVNIGVPQGSPLSALLFTIAINSLSELLQKIPKVEHTFFADDFLIYGSFKKRAPNNIQKALNQTEKWCKSMGFEISPQKNQHIHFCRLKNCPRKTYSIYNTPITQNNNLKYLGLHFDEKLTFKTHIEKTSTKNAKTLNIIKILAHPKNGISTQNLIKITNSLIRSSLEYGCQVYTTATKTTIKYINTIYNAAIRTSLGALRTSPIESIHKEAGTYLLSERISELTTKHILKVKSNIDHPNHQIANTITSNNNRLKSGIQKAIEALITENYPLDKLQTTKKVTFPPWHLHNFQTDTTLATNTNKTTNPLIQKSKSLQLIDKYNEFKKIYTDGSKTNLSSSYGIHSKDLHIEKRVKLNPNTSIFNAEAQAIVNAIEIHNPAEKTLILTDSLSVVKGIESRNQSTENIILIKQKLINHSNLKIAWIPSHIGIQGNEKADQLANEAHQHPDTTKDDIFVTDMYRMYTIAQRQKRQTNWINSTSKLALAYTEYDNSIKRTRTDEVFLTRLRIGHTNITHSHIYSQTPQPGCTNCQIALSIKHILIDCNRPDITKFRLDNKLNDKNLKELLNRKQSNEQILALRKLIDLF